MDFSVAYTHTWIYLFFYNFLETICFLGLLWEGLGPSQLPPDPQLSFELGKHLRTFNRCLWKCAWEMAMAPRF